MSLDWTTDPTRTNPAAWLREHRRLARHDRVNAHLAELHFMAELAAEATELVGVGWVQHGWFSYVDTDGRERKVTAHNLYEMSGQPVSGACLVGAIVHSGGGPGAAHSQLVQRSLDLTWHTLHLGSREPVRWCPAPQIRSAHVRDLTRWNDRRGRTADDVTDLLVAVKGAAVAEIERVRGRTSATH